MKKHILTFLFLSATFIYADAQGYYYFKDSTGTNPGNLNTENTEYPVGGGIGLGWLTILGPSNSSPTLSPSQTIPFTFNFNGVAVTSYKAISNGSISFDASPTVPSSYGTVTLPSSTYPNNSVNIVGIQGSGANDNIVSKTFGTAPNRQHWIHFSSYTSSAITSGWTYWAIVLEETTNKIYVVDMRSNAIHAGITVGIQLNSTTAVSESGYATLSSNDPTPQDNRFFEFLPNPQPSFDMAGKSSTVYHTHALSSAPFNITGTLQNRGAATVTSYNINYKVGAGSTVTSNISGVSVATGAITNFSHPINWNPTAIGTYTIEAWASNINGNPDANTADDTVIFTVEIVDTIIPRKSLLEAFTSSSAGPGFSSNKLLDTVVVPALSAGTYTIIKYQQDFPGIGDPYSTTKSVARRTFYGINSIPNMEIDGQWSQSMFNITKPIIESFQTEPSFISIDILSTSVTGNTVSINADIKPWANLSGNLKYHVVITEKKTTQNATTNGQTEFFNVMMDMLPNENGSSLTSLTKGVVTNINMVSAFDTTNVEEFNDLKVVIFVQDSLSKKILQSEWMDISSSTYGTDSITACDSYTWINGITYSASNNSATDTLINAAGGDSVVTLNLTINNSNTGTDVQTACNSYTWIDGITYTSSNNTATDTLTNAAGCDSVVTLNLTITNSSSATDVVSSCNSYTWIDGITYTASNNTATDTLTNAAGCDSVVTLNLTIINSNTGTDVQTACNSYTWIDGITYTSSNNTATDTLTNAAGCDSVVTLNLTINNSNTGVDVQTACDSYTWINGVTYTSSNNTATDTLTNAQGCDSVVTLNLTINPSAVITSQPVNQTVFIGDNAQFQVTASGTGLTYQWQQNNGTGFTDISSFGIYSGTTTNTLTITGVNASIQQNGYRCKISNSTGCSDTTVAAILYISLTSIDENGVEESFKLFPNPTSSQLNIETSITYSSGIIINALGQTVMQFKNEKTLDVSQLKTGNYILLVKGENNEVLKTEKFSKY
ncbi:T9SS type A sorting domain-containing protein [Flavobacteriales bacterium]|nr:T9SS type A sorting domain-containing protein [Flavobacteriales bacterium]